MLIIYDSLTGNVERFVKKLKINNQILKIKDGLIISEPYILVTYTIGFGQVPESTAKFLVDNHKYLIGVASSGNKNWGSFFGNAANIISDKFNVPLILKFELSGTDNDVITFIQEVEKLDRNYS